MWDLETLRYLNEHALLGTLKIVNDGIVTPGQPSPQPVFPLSILAYKLISGPPSLSRLIDLLENSDSIAYFLELVRELLPEHEAEIMAQYEDLDRIEVFCRRFSRQYFPLQEVENFYDDFTISDFVQQIPVELMGFSYEDYESFNDFREGFILLLSLVESPYDSDQRVPILERVKDIVGMRLVEIIPQDGWSVGEIHSMLDGSQYEGCCAFADWIHSCTGCYQLDTNYADYYVPEDWSRGIVNDLTEQWPVVTELTNKMQKMYQWLEEDIPHNFAELLAKMLGEDVVEYETVPKEQIPFPLDSNAQVIL